MTGIDFIFDSVQLLYYKCHKINFKLGGSYIDSPDWLKKINNKYKIKRLCFQYSVTLALNYEEIKWNPERVSNIKPFINNITGKE